MDAYSNGQRLWDVGSRDVSAINTKVCAVDMPAQTIAATATVRWAPKFKTAVIRNSATYAATKAAACVCSMRAVYP